MLQFLQTRCEGKVILLQGDVAPGDWFEGLLELQKRYNEQSDDYAKGIPSLRLRLRRSPPLPKAINNLDLGILWLRRADLRYYDKEQRERAWFKVQIHLIQAESNIESAQKHIEKLKGAKTSFANAVDEHMRAKTNIEHHWEDKQQKYPTSFKKEEHPLRSWEEFDKWGKKVLEDVIVQHEQDIESITQALQQYRQYSDQAFEADGLNSRA
ncbi:hypothetical protein ACQY0O_008136 [Thecaphora frezii]